MKWIVSLPFIFLLTLPADQCGKKEKENSLYKGRLEVKGICMNYTIRLLEGKMDTSEIVTSWKNEATGKTHTNVFALSSPCTFPSSIKEGDEFFFSIDPSPVRDCAVCLAYYPTPPKRLSIKVMDK